MIRPPIFLIGMSIAVAVSCMGSSSWAQNTTDPSQNDKRFVQSELEAENAEVVLGQLAAQKGSSEDVRQFGQKMVDDHKKLGDEMRDVAHTEGIRPQDNTAAKDRDLQAKLKALSGPAFDQAYIQAMVKDHRQDLDAFQKEANKGNDTAIKDAAGRGAMLIEEHLKMAEDLARSHRVQTGQ